MTTPHHRSAALVRTAPARRTAPQPQPRTARHPLAAAPPTTAAAAFAAGVALSFAPPVVAIAAPVAVTVAGLAVVQRRTWPRPIDHALAVAAVLAVGAVLFSTATGPSLRGALITAALAALAVAVVRRHPTVLAWKEQQARRAHLDRLAASWPQVALGIGMPQIRLTGPVVDRGTGHTYQVASPAGSTIGMLKQKEAELSTAFDPPVRRDDVHVEVDESWPSIALIHIREQHADDQAAARIADATITSITEPLPIGAYVDGKPYLLRLFEKLVGSIDTLLAGATGSGKSALLLDMLKLLLPVDGPPIPDVKILIWDGATGRDLKKFARRVFRYTSDPREVHRQAQIIGQIIRDRAATMDRKGWTVWQPSATDPVILIFIDEMATFGDGPYAHDTAKVLGVGSSKNRAVGVVFVGLTQHPVGMAGLGADLMRNMPNRIQTRVDVDGFTCLRNHGLRPIALEDDLAFYAETYDENRGILAHGVWLSDEERAAIAAGPTGDDSLFAAEWAAAELAAHGTPDMPAADKPAPEVDVEEEEPVEGEILEVRSVEFPLLRPLPTYRTPMEFGEARRAFKTFLRDNGKASVQDLRVLTGWDEVDLREQLIAPGMDTGWLDYADDTDGMRVYVPVKEWLAAERAARN
jgi:hypothetical protein